VPAMTAETSSRGNNLAIDGERLWDTLLETAKFGATAKGGICRLTLSGHDRDVRHWFKSQIEALGCTLTVDDMGVMYARRRGQRNDIPPIAFGSHLDTQPTGGKFDGALGTLAALEVLRTLHTAEYETFAPVEIINWTNEEGSRFAPALIASGVYAGVFERDWAYAREDRSGIKFGDALGEIGYLGREGCGNRKFSAFFELHIEQGPILEREAKDIGVVTGVQGVRWFELTLIGQDAHTGSTPMMGRRNALVGAARAIMEVDKIALAHSPHAVATVGLLEVNPNSRNVIPGKVFFTVDMRHPHQKVLDAMEQELKAAVEAISGDINLDLSLERIWDQAPLVFDDDCIKSVRKAVTTCGYSALDIISGAQHDAAYIARVAPSSMIFVPCRGGISHNEEEFTSKEQCMKGAQVLLRTVLYHDRCLAALHGASQC
jgi:beta-ureidopropionase / N-carbamoyl-L-amino-acid hydrolase